MSILESGAEIGAAWRAALGARVRRWVGVSCAVLGLLADFAAYGDLPSIIGRASGLDTRVLASQGKFNLVIAVPADSPIQKVEDLKGRKFAIFKGTCLQLGAARLLEAHGLSERAVRAIDMDGATARAALATKDVDAVISSSDLFSLRDQGLARVIYTTKGESQFSCNGTLTGSGEFIRKYPSITQRVVNTYVRAAKWLADRQADPSEAFQLWTRSGQRFSEFKEDWQGDVIKDRASPLIDAYLLGRYTDAIADARRYGLIRKSFDVEPWVDTRFLAHALEESQLGTFWTPLAPQRASTASPSASPSSIPAQP